MKRVIAFCLVSITSALGAAMAQGLPPGARLPGDAAATATNPTNRAVRAQSCQSIDGNTRCVSIGGIEVADPVAFEYDHTLLEVGEEVYGTEGYRSRSISCVVPRRAIMFQDRWVKIAPILIGSSAVSCTSAGYDYSTQAPWPYVGDIVVEGYWGSPGYEIHGVGSSVYLNRIDGTSWRASCSSGYNQLMQQGGFRLGDEYHDFGSPQPGEWVDSYFSWTDCHQVTR